MTCLVVLSSVRPSMQKHKLIEFEERMLLPPPPLPLLSSSCHHQGNTASVIACLDINEEREVFKMLVNHVAMPPTGLPHLGFTSTQPPSLPPPHHHHGGAMSHGPGPLLYCAHCPTTELGGPLMTTQVQSLSFLYVILLYPIHLTHCSDVTRKRTRRT